jgi:hypothetical protein
VSVTYPCVLGHAVQSCRFEDGGVLPSTGSESATSYPTGSRSTGPRRSWRTPDQGVCFVASRARWDALRRRCCPGRCARLRGRPSTDPSRRGSACARDATDRPPPPRYETDGPQNRERAANGYGTPHEERTRGGASRGRDGSPLRELSTPAGGPILWGGGRSPL